jgi:hypothetical protein
VFTEFAAQPVEGTGEDPDDDLVLFQCGIAEPDALFEWSLCRQFSLYARGDYDHLEQLERVLFFERTPELDQTDGAVSGFWPVKTHLGHFVEEVPRLDAYTAVLGREPVRSFVAQGEV